MTVIVSVKINDGIVMASDSASTFTNTQVYDHAEKIVNLVKGLPIGAMATGDGGIGSESLTTLLKDLGKRLADKQDSMYLDPSSYTMAGVAGRAHQFLFAEKSMPSGGTANILLRDCGYSAGRPLPEVWQVQLQGAISYQLLLVHAETTLRRSVGSKSRDLCGHRGARCRGIPVRIRYGLVPAIELSSMARGLASVPCPRCAQRPGTLSLSRDRLPAGDGS
jgi:hypothetical protein